MTDDPWTESYAQRIAASARRDGFPGRVSSHGAAVLAERYGYAYHAPATAPTVPLIDVARYIARAALTCRD